jgi:dihydroorotate dehydrogenase
VQLYSALVFHGFGLVGRIKRSMVDALRSGQYASVGDLVGADAAAMTAEPWPE